MSSKNENSFLKFVKSLRPFEWAIIVVIVFFLGVFIWGFSQPKVTPEIKAINPETKVRLYEFWGQGCPHCAVAAPFLEKIDNEIKELEVIKYETYYNTDNQEKNKKVAEALGKEAGGVPFIVVGDQVFQGYDDENGIGKEIKERVDYCIQNSCPDKAGEVLGFQKLANTKNEEAKKEEKFATISTKEAKKLIEENKDNSNFVILDVRTLAEFNENKIDEKAINIDVENPDFVSEINKLDKTKNYLVYCRTGRRSADASKIMSENGFTQIKNMDGGTVEWFNTTKTD
jgi:rhodanese-related sulfurtransferase/glutaredoxin